MKIYNVTRISSITKSNLQASEKTIEIKSKIKEFQNYIKRNFEYVGENLPMRPDQSIMEVKSKKGIYGNASSKDIKELKEEGRNNGDTLVKKRGKLNLFKFANVIYIGIFTNCPFIC